MEHERFEMVIDLIGATMVRSLFTTALNSEGLTLCIDGHRIVSDDDSVYVRSIIPISQNSCVQLIAFLSI